MRLTNASLRLAMRRTMTPFAPFRRSEEGVAAVELAFVLPVLLMLMIGIIDLSSLFFLRNNMVTIARDSARALAVGAVTTAEAEKLAEENLVNWNATFTVTATEPLNPDDTDVVVTISVPMAEAAPIGLVFDLTGLDGTLQTQVTMRQE